MPRLVLVLALLVAITMASIAGCVAFKTEEEWRCWGINDDSGECGVFDVCSSCMQTSGCMFDFPSKQCGVIVPRRSSNGSTSELRYCSSTDATCASCLSSSGGACRGEGGCKCRQSCEPMQSVQDSCVTERWIKHTISVAILLAILVPCLVWSYRRCMRDDPHDATHLPVAGRHCLQVVAARGEEPTAVSTAAVVGGDPRSLHLGGWRATHAHHQARDERVVHYETGTCYVLMDAGGNEMTTNGPCPDTDERAVVSSSSRIESVKETVDSNEETRIVASSESLAQTGTLNADNERRITDL